MPGSSAGDNPFADQPVEEVVEQLLQDEAADAATDLKQQLGEMDEQNQQKDLQRQHETELHGAEGGLDHSERGGGEPTHQRQDGAIHSADYDATIMSTLSFFQGLQADSQLSQGGGVGNGSGGGSSGGGGGKSIIAIMLSLGLLLVLVKVGLFVLPGIFAGGGGSSVSRVVAAPASTATGIFPTPSVALATPTLAAVPTAATILPTATAPQVRATATPTPLPAQLVVSQTPSSGVFSCAGPTSTDYPSYTVHNSGGRTLSWSATTDDQAQVTLSPASGTLAAGASTGVHLSGNATTGQVKVSFTSKGGSASFAIECGKP